MPDDPYIHPMWTGSNTEIPRITPDTGEFFARKKFFEKIRFVELHKYSADFSVFRAGIRLFVQNFRLIFVQYAVSGDF